MAFTSPDRGDKVYEWYITQLIDAWTGVTGAGVAVSLTALSDSSNYAIDVRNLDGTNSYGLRVRDSANADLLKIYKNNIVLGSAATHITTIYGKTYIGDTANANMTLGLTINQAGNDDEILALKSSDVAHGMTTLTETDTFGLAKKSVAATGGMALQGYSSATLALTLGGLGVTDDTTKSTAGTAYVQVNAYKKNGTTVGDCGADANLFVIVNNATTRFIFDAEGSGHADVEFTTFDKYDDLALVRDIEDELLLGEDEAKTERRHALEATGIIGKDSWHMENGRPRAMINFTRLAMLHHGSLLQVGATLGDMRATIGDLRGRLAIAEQRLAALPSH